jgi:hypothetical protein
MANPTMTVERYLPARHYEMLCRWLHFYDQEPLDPVFLPPTGFVVDGLAMGFLVRTDTGLAHLEPLLANGYAPRPARDAATDLVVAAILEEARTLGFRIVQGATTLDAVVERALRHGFTVGDERYRHVLRVLDE